MVDAYKALPCIKDAFVEPRKPTRIVVVWKSGESNSVAQVFPPQASPSERRLIWSLMGNRAGSVAEDIEKDGYFLSGRICTDEWDSANGCERVLLPLAEALSTNATEQAFFEAARTWIPIFKNSSDNVLRPYWEHRADVPLWKPRVLAVIRRLRGGSSGRFGVNGSVCSQIRML